MTTEEFDDLITQTCKLYIEECAPKYENEDIEEVKFSKRHQKMMKKLFREIKKGKEVKSYWSALCKNIDFSDVYKV